MSARRDIAVVLAAAGIADLGLRISLIVLPLVALAQTQSAWTTGLAVGCAGLPALTLPWWGAAVRHLVRDGRHIALALVVQATGVLIVPVVVLLRDLQWWHLAISGTVVGAAAVVVGPAQSAMLADLGDGLGDDCATRAVTLRDLIRRLSMVIGPPAGALLLTVFGAQLLLWAEAVALVLAALALISVNEPSSAHDNRRGIPSPPVARSIRQVLHDHPDLVRGFIMRGTGCLLWFGFSLGLAVLGAQQGRPGVLIASAMSGYGIGSLLGGALAVAVIHRLAPLPTEGISWLGLGLAFIAMAVMRDSVPGLVMVSALGGFAMPVGIAAINHGITSTTFGHDRRTAFAAQSMVVESTSSIGFLIGGPILTVFDPAWTIAACGLVQLVVTSAVLTQWAMTNKRTATRRAPVAERSRRLSLRGN